MKKVINALDKEGKLMEVTVDSDGTCYVERNGEVSNLLDIYHTLPIDDQNVLDDLEDSLWDLPAYADYEIRSPHRLGYVLTMVASPSDWTVKHYLGNTEIYAPDRCIHINHCDILYDDQIAEAEDKYRAISEYVRDKIGGNYNTEQLNEAIFTAMISLQNLFD